MFFNTRRLQKRRPQDSQYLCHADRFQHAHLLLPQWVRHLGAPASQGALSSICGYISNGPKIFSHGEGAYVLYVVVVLIPTEKTPLFL